MGARDRFGIGPCASADEHRRVLVRPRDVRRGNGDSPRGRYALKHLARNQGLAARAARDWRVFRAHARRA